MKTPKVYATTKKRYSDTELLRLGFRRVGVEWIKRYAGTILATAGEDGRVTPYARYWR